MSVDVNNSPDDSPDGDGYARNFVKGVRWSALSRYGVQSIQLVTSLTLARLLAPEHFGLLAMALVFIEFARVCLNLGFSQVIVQRKEIDDELLSSLFFLNIAVSVLLAGILAAASPLVCWFYGNWDLLNILLTLAFTLVLASPSLVPAAVLQRGLKFGRLAVVDMCCAGARAVVAIVMALLGFEVWSLVGGAIVASVGRPVLMNFAAPWRPQLVFSWRRVREVVNFSANLTGFSLVNFFARNADNLIIGRFLGEISLGYYSMAYRILTYPREAVSSVVGRVLLPTFSKLQHDNARLAAAYMRVSAAIAFVTFPMMLGLMAVADSFVRAVLDDKWLPALPVIYIFCPLGMVQSVGTTIGHLYIAKGRTDVMFRVSLVRTPLVIAAFFIGLPWGITGVAVSYASMTMLTWLPATWFAFKLVPGMRMRDLLLTMLPHTVHSAVMAAAVFFLQTVLRGQGVDAWLTLVICIPVGVAIYSAIVLAVQPRGIDDFLSMIPSRLRGKKSKSNHQPSSPAKERQEPNGETAHAEDMAIDGEDREPRQLGRAASESGDD